MLVKIWVVLVRRIEKAGKGKILSPLRWVLHLCDPVGGDVVARKFVLIPQNSVDRRLVAVFFDRFIELFEHLFLVLRQRAPDADLQHVVEAVVDKSRNVQQLDQAAVLDEVIQLAGRNKASGLRAKSW